MEQRRPGYRHCNTHALVATLFAASTKNSESQQAWRFVADAWAELARMKQRDDLSAAGRPPLPSSGSDDTIADLARTSSGQRD